MEKRWKVHKFGGSSLADADCFRRVAGLMLEERADCIGVVVSAMAGMTDALLELTGLAEQNRTEASEAVLDELAARYRSTARELLDSERLDRVLAEWQSDADDIGNVLRAVALVPAAAPRSRDVVSGYGEIWSARLLAAVLEHQDAARGGVWIDARQLITVSHTGLGPTVLWQPSAAGFRASIAEDFTGIAVVTGYIAADEQGLQTTLGRNGSDFSAAILAALAGADELSIWTDVDGVMSADPRRVPEAQVIDRLSYNEVMELAYFGATVVHPQTLGPVVERCIPVTIRNSRNPQHPGSLISSPSAKQDGIKGITAIGGMALVNLEGSGMIGVPGTADRLFAALKQAGVSVTLISQASSEHSICVAVPEVLAERAKDVISAAFATELANGQIQRVDIAPAKSIVAVVGDGMRGTPGIAARFFGTLGRAGINLRAIAQGCSERNISAVVDASEATRALRAAHSGFYLSSKTLSIGLIGPGVVGAALLRQIGRRARQLIETFNLDLRVRAIARSQSMLLDERRIELASWQDRWAHDAEPIDWARFEAQVNPDHLPHAVVIDCTASDDIAARYGDWLKRGIHVITPNKKALSDSYASYKALMADSRTGSAHYLYEATVGAALPVITTLRDLVDTGDEIRSIAGIFSGTLAYLFNVYDGSVPFSAIVCEAKESGYTEPDPREDLSGTDVARKLTILARENDMPLEMTGFPVENLVPQALRGVSVDEFLKRLSDIDASIAARYAAARRAGQRLRYVARLLADGTASVGLEAVADDHPFSNIHLTDNVVQFQTARYDANPLVIQGPGAGPEVTAGAVFGDLLRLAKYLSAGAWHD